MDKLSALEARLASLEQQNKRIRLAFKALFIVCLGTILMGQYRENSIHRTKFIVADQEGHARAVLGLAGDEPSLVFYGKTRGYPVVSIRVKDDHAAIVLQEPQGHEIWRAPTPK